MGVKAQAFRLNSKHLPNILLVSLEKDIVTLKRGLEHAGFHTNVYHDSSTALEHLRQDPKSCFAVVSDIIMPKMTGLQLAREINKLNPEVRVILVSTFDIGKEFTDVLPSLKVDGFITKPAKISTLIKLLSKHVGQIEHLTGCRAK